MIAWFCWGVDNIDNRDIFKIIFLNPIVKMILLNSITKGLEEKDNTSLTFLSYFPKNIQIGGKLLRRFATSRNELINILRRSRVTYISLKLV